MIRTLVGVVGLSLIGVLAGAIYLNLDRTEVLSVLGAAGGGCIIVWVLISIGAGERGGRLRR